MSVTALRTSFLRTTPSVLKTSKPVCLLKKIGPVVWEMPRGLSSLTSRSYFPAFDPLSVKTANVYLSQFRSFRSSAYESFRQQTSELRYKNLVKCDVLKYSDVFRENIDPICFDMGSCENEKDHTRYDDLLEQLKVHVKAITQDEKERSKIYAYINRSIIDSLLVHTYAFIQAERSKEED